MVLSPLKVTAIISQILHIVIGLYSGWISDDNTLQKEEVDERVFLYQEDGQYYLYKQGQHLKKLSKDDINKIFNYIMTNKIS